MSCFLLLLIKSTRINRGFVKALSCEKLVYARGILESFDSRLIFCLVGLGGDCFPVDVLEERVRFKLICIFWRGSNTLLRISLKELFE
jgi:hypothetical protein